MSECVKTEIGRTVGTRESIKDVYPLRTKTDHKSRTKDGVNS